MEEFPPPRPPDNGRYYNTNQTLHSNTVYAAIWCYYRRWCHLISTDTNKIRNKPMYKIRQTDKQDFNGNDVQFVLARLIIIIIMSQGQPTDRVSKEEIRCFTQLVFSPYRSKGDTTECETTYLCYCFLYHSRDVRLGFLQWWPELSIRIYLIGELII